jgi:capsular exopolysaccharide synthesis family protein
MLPVDPSKLDAPKAPAAPAAPGRQALALGPAELPPALSTTPTVWSLLRALRRRWLPALLVSGALGAAAAAAAYYAPIFPKAGAYSVVHVNPVTPTFFNNQGDTVDLERYQKTLLIVAKSPGVLKTALAQPEVADLAAVKEQSDPQAWLEQNLVVDFLLGPQDMKINLKGDRPDQLKVVVRAITQAFLTEVWNQEQRERKDRLDGVAKAAAEEGRIFDEKQKAFKALVGLDKDAELPPPGFRPRNLEQLIFNEAELNRVQATLGQQQARLDTRLAKGPSAAELAVPDGTVDEQAEARLASDPMVANLNQEAAKLNAEMARVADVALDPAAQTAKHRYRLDQIARTVEERRAQIRKAIVKTLEERNRQAFALETSKLQAEVDALKAQDKQLTEKVNGLTEETKKLKKELPDLDKQRLDLQQREKLVNRLVEQEKTLRVELTAPSRLKMELEAGAAPKDDKRQMQMAGLSGLGMLGLSLFGFSFWEFRRRRVQSPDEVAQGLGMRLLGSVPRLPASALRQVGEPDAGIAPAWQAALHESIDVVRTVLLHAARAEGLKVVMVSSAVEGEGKTTLASQLAASLARSGRRTLLIDCDLRKPTAHRLFGLPQEPGFCELLRGEVDGEDVIKATRLARLCLVPAGISDAHATQTLGQEPLALALREFRGQFDFVIIDSAPVLPVADSLQIGQHADGVILSLLNDQSRLPDVHAAQQRLVSLGVRVLGAVVNGTRTDHYGSQYQKAVAQVR